MRQVPAITKLLAHLVDDGTLTSIAAAFHHAATSLRWSEAL
jgi:hypothetical protein